MQVIGGALYFRIEKLVLERTNPENGTREMMVEWEHKRRTWETEANLQKYVPEFLKHFLSKVRQPFTGNRMAQELGCRFGCKMVPRHINAEIMARPDSSSSNESPKKRGRGRPRTRTNVTCPVQKSTKKRGRPRKDMKVNVGDKPGPSNQSTEASHEPGPAMRTRGRLNKTTQKNNK